MAAGAQLGELVGGELIGRDRASVGEVHGPAVVVDPELAGGPAGVQDQQPGVRVDPRALHRAGLDQHVHGGLIA